jgi:hypothetical protein
MVAYLCDHFRYHTMNSWNGASSYAANIKLHQIMPGNLDGYDFLQTDEAFRHGNDIIREFEERHHYEWQIGSNGRSGGYLVLYQGGMKPSGHKSFCPSCGQLNFTRAITDEVLEDKSRKGRVLRFFLEHPIWTNETYVKNEEIKKLGLKDEEIVEIVEAARKDIKENGRISGQKCGVCPGKRVNFKKTHMTTFTYPGKGVDGDMPDFESWEMWELQQRVNVVWDFDKTVERVVKAFIAFVRSHKVVEKQIMVPKTIQVAVPVGEEDDD